MGERGWSACIVTSVFNVTAWGEVKVKFKMLYFDLSLIPLINCLE